MSFTYRFYGQPSLLYIFFYYLYSSFGKNLSFLIYFSILNTSLTNPLKGLYSLLGIEGKTYTGSKGLMCRLVRNFTLFGLAPSISSMFKL